jgi:hypothetical protein
MEISQILNFLYIYTYFLSLFTLRDMPHKSLQIRRLKFSKSPSKTAHLILTDTSLRFRPFSKALVISLLQNHHLTDITNQNRLAIKQIQLAT